MIVDSYMQAAAACGCLALVLMLIVGLTPAPSESQRRYYTLMTALMVLSLIAGVVCLALSGQVFSFNPEMWPLFLGAALVGIVIYRLHTRHESTRLNQEERRALAVQFRAEGYLLGYNAAVAAAPTPPAITAAPATGTAAGNLPPVADAQLTVAGQNPLIGDWIGKVMEWVVSFLCGIFLLALVFLFLKSGPLAWLLEKAQKGSQAVQAQVQPTNTSTQQPRPATGDTAPKTAPKLPVTSPTDYEWDATKGKVVFKKDPEPEFRWAITYVGKDGKRNEAVTGNEISVPAEVTKVTVFQFRPSDNQANVGLELLTPAKK